ncbi:SCP2 sterol-binding domain-containing protein [Micromonospora sp. DT31]|uniref:SCP2 sterol-binding domain-containing protein n=1 Tax=Micromonospora sp. DT31 TaxID=3393434 RepID=UPI003CEFDAAD
MSEAIQRFFVSLPTRAASVLNSPVGGILQIDLADGNRTEHWYVTLAPGSAQVGREQQRPADGVLSLPVDLFERLVTGREAWLATLLRNDATFSGHVVLLLAFRRFLPGRPDTPDPRETARDHVRRLA